MTTEQIESITESAKSILRMEEQLRRKILDQQNRITVALAYIRAGQPHLAALALEGMQP